MRIIKLPTLQCFECYDVLNTLIAEGKKEIMIEHPTYDVTGTTCVYAGYKFYTDLERFVVPIDDFIEVS